MKTLIILSLFAWRCFAADFDTTTVHKVIVTIEHELTYTKTVVEARCYWKSENRWYVRLADGGEMWSDKPIRRVK